MTRRFRIPTLAASVLAAGTAAVALVPAGASAQQGPYETGQPFADPGAPFPGSTAGQGMEQEGGYIIVETDRGYYVVQPRQGPGPNRMFRAYGPTTAQAGEGVGPQAGRAGIEDIGRELFMRGYMRGRMEERMAQEQRRRMQMEREQQDVARARDEMTNPEYEASQNISPRLPDTEHGAGAGARMDQQMMQQMHRQMMQQMHRQMQMQQQAARAEAGRQPGAPVEGPLVNPEYEASQNISPRLPDDETAQLRAAVDEARRALQQGDRERAERVLQRVEGNLDEGERQRLQRAISDAEQALEQDDAQAAQQALGEARRALQPQQQGQREGEQRRQGGGQQQQQQDQQG